MKKSILLQSLIVLLFFFPACRKEQYPAPDISGTGDERIILNIGDKIVLAPNITNLKGNSYTWLVNGKENTSGQLHYTFEATEPGDFDVTFKVTNKGGADQQSFKIFVEDPIEISIADQLEVSMANILEITPAVTGPDRDDYQYEWSIADSVIGKKPHLSFISPVPGIYKLTLRATAGKQTATSSCMVTVKEKQYEKNAYTLLEYAPSPARNHNWSIIGYADSWKYGGEYALPYNDFLAKATAIRKQDYTAALIIGSWGGSATFKFDHTVANVPGKTDIELSAIYSIRDLPAVFVAYDRNKNGIADEDEWYEIKNDDYGLEDMPEYEITFTHIKTETDERRIYTHFTWKDNQAEPAQGDIAINKTFTSALTTAGVISTRGLFPGINLINFDTKEIALLQGWPNSFSRKGKRISRNLSGAPAYSQKLNIDIGLAVNEKGESIQLPGIDFIKVQKVIYPFHQDLSTGGILTDYNMDEKRMLHVSSIIDKHLPN